MSFLNVFSNKLLRSWKGENNFIFSFFNKIRIFVQKGTGTDVLVLKQFRGETTPMPFCIIHFRSLRVSLGISFGRYFLGTSSGFFGDLTFLLTLPMVTTVSSDAFEVLNMLKYYRYRKRVNVNLRFFL